MSRGQDDKIDDAVVAIHPDLSTFQSELKTALEKQAAKSKQPYYKVKVVADGTGLRDSVRLAVAKQMALGKQPVYKVKVVADATGLKKSIGDLGGTVTQAAKRAETDLTAAHAAGIRERRAADVKANQDALKNLVALRLATLRNDLIRTRNANEQVQRANDQARREDITREERASAERTKILKAEEKRRQEAFTPFSKGQKLIDLGGEGLKPMSLLYGIVAAMTPALFAMGASALQASTSIAALGAAGIGAALGIGAIAIAFNGIGDLLTLRKSVQNEATTKAANSAQNAVRAADDLAQAKRNLADAQRDEKRANEDIHKARQEAIRDLEDLRTAVRDLDNEYKSNALTVAEKKQDALAADRNFFATALDKARAHQDVADAQTQLVDTGLQRKRKKEDLKESVSKGVEGSDKVRDARERIRDARDRTLNAQDALRKSATGFGGGLDKTSSAAAQLAKKIKELSPAAQEMYYWFDKNEGLFKRLQKSIAQATLPGFNTFLKAITAGPKGTSTLEIAAKYAGELGAIIGEHVGEFGEFTKGPLFRGSMARIQKTNADAFDKLGDALIKLADPITRILDKASPAFGAFADKVLELSTRFADFIAKADKDGSLAKWFEDSRIEAKKWYDIATNIGELLKNLFKGALPAGGSLVANFETFTKSLADWSGSPEGTKQIKDFFDKIKNLPYAKIIDFLKNAVIFFAAYRTFTLLKGINPIFAAIGVFAASNPEAAAAAFSTIATAVGKAIGFFVANPEAAAGLLTLIAAAKVGKAVGFSLKLPAMDRLQTALTTKFKFLDQFLGGSTSTGVMNVRAGVVNVYGGGTDVDLPGKKPKPGIVPTGIPGPAPSAISNLAVGALSVAGGLYAATFIVDTILGKDGSTVDGFKSLLMGPEAYSEWSKKNAPAFRRFFTMTLPGWITAGGDRGWSSFKDSFINTFGEGAAHFFSTDLPNALNLGAGGSGGWAGLATNLGRFFSTTLPNGISGRSNGWAGVGGFMLDGLLNGFIGAEAWSTTMEKINGWVDGFVGWVKNLFGIASPSTVFATIGGNLIDGLWTGFTDKWNSLRETATTWITNNFTNPLTSIFTTAGTVIAAGFASGFGTLTKKLAGPATAVLKWIDANFINKINTLLGAIGVTPIPTLTGRPLKDVGKDAGKAIGDIAKRIGDGYGLAGGGTVPGHSPHPRADNIPAMLTADEFVQPVAAVKHYGTDFMEAVRTRQLPRYASGGLVGALTGSLGDNLLTKIAGAAITRAGGSVTAAVSKLLGGMGGGGSDQEYKGRTPGGLGAVRGLGQRMMAAVVAIHKQFPWASVTSGYRPGAITVTGNKSYHGKRRATDWPASMELFNYFVKQYGRNAKEIIYSPASGRQIWNGREHMYTGAVRRTHFNHVHLALAEGGLVPRKYDSGGILPPGYSLAFNGTGQNETIRTDKQEQALGGATRLDRRDLALLAQFMAGAVGSPTISMDGRKVAETTNRYNYLPTGV